MKNDFAEYVAEQQAKEVHLDLQTASMLLRTIMEAHYSDAINYRVARQKKIAISPTEYKLGKVQELLSGMCVKVSEAMDSGELNPFRGDYTDWLVKENIIEPLDKQEK